MYLVNKSLLRGRLNRWLMLFQEFIFLIVVKLGKAHIISDQLSKVHNGEKVVGVHDDFLNTTLFNIKVVLIEWYQDIIEFLIMGQCPQNLDKTQKKNLI